LKILLANKFFFRNGGSETVFFQEREFLLKSGKDVVDFSMRDSRNLDSPFSDYFVEEKNFKKQSNRLVDKIGNVMSFIHSKEAVHRVSELIDKEKPDILHCHNIYHQLTPSIMKTAKKMGVKVVLTLHDYKVVCPVYTRLQNGKSCSDCLQGDFFNVVRHRCADGSFAKSILLYIEAITQRLMGSYDVVDMVIVPSRFMAESVTQWRFPKDKINLLYNGVDCQGEGFPIKDDGYILFLGRLSQEKGLMTLGSAQVGTDIRVVVAGTGPLEGLIREKFPGLELVGHQDGENLKKLIRQAAAIVVPSEWYENCPMSILEGMSFGKPIIASRIGGIPELISDGETGLLFEPGNTKQLRSAMKWILADKDRLRSFGNAARQRLESQFSLEMHNNRLMDIYKSLL
jgi:glycosyltransferase involved in cell wall biosynthesis